MSDPETNPHFSQQQPLLPSKRAPMRPDRDPRPPPKQYQVNEPLHGWRGPTKRSDQDPRPPSRPNQGPLHGWDSMAHPLSEWTTKWKWPRRQGNTKPSGPVAVQQRPESQPEGHHTSLPSVTPQQERGGHPPSGSPADQQARPAREKPNRFLPRDRRTKLPTWFAAVFCAIFWIVIILGGLVILIVYLVFRPKSPRFDVANVNLNAAYLDMGYLLNADLVLLINFTNPNHKVGVDFSSMYLDLYFENTMIATQYVQPFSAPRGTSMLATIHMMSSQVPLAIKESLLLQQQIQNSSVIFDLKGKFRARSNFGSLIRYSYWLHGLCRVIVSSPPTGVLRGKNCITKQ